MLIFTNDDYRRIQAWLKANSVKDSELPHFTSENGSEKIAILQDGKNVLITLNELKQLIGGIVRVLTPPTISNVNNKVVIDAKIYDTIYYTVSTTTDYYPYLDSTGKPIDINNTLVYNQPFDITENVTVRAIAVFTNSEGEILQSSITEELVYLQKEIDIPTPNNNLTYKGEEQTGFTNLDTSEDSPYTISGVIKATNAGEYEAIFTLKNTAETKWKDIDEGISEVKVSWSIKKKQTSINWNVSSEYKVGNTILAATNDDKFEINYSRGNGEDITLPYTVKDSDKGTLSIKAEIVLPDEAKNNYEGYTVTKQFTIKEQSIPYEYGFMSVDTLTEIAGKYSEDMNKITAEDVKEKINLIELTSSKVTVSATEDVTVVSYPKGTNMQALESGTLNEYEVVGNNSSDDINIKLYLIGAGTNIDFVKE